MGPEDQDRAVSGLPSWYPLPEIERIPDGTLRENDDNSHSVMVVGEWVKIGPLETGLVDHCMECGRFDTHNHSNGHVFTSSRKTEPIEPTFRDFAKWIKAKHDLLVINHQTGAFKNSSLLLTIDSRDLTEFLKEWDKNA